VKSVQYCCSIPLASSVNVPQVYVRTVVRYTLILVDREKYLSLQIRLKDDNDRQSKSDTPLYISLVPPSEE